MSVERELNVAAHVMFQHAKNVVTKNVRAAVAKGELTIDESKLPGLELLIERSIDDAYKQSAKQLTETVRNLAKSNKIIDR